MERGIIRAAGLLFAIGAIGIGGWTYAAHWRPSTNRYALQGIDVAPDDDAIEWGSVRAAGADFAYLTATVGARHRDARFEANWAALPDAGLRRGAVHVYSLCEASADQANAFNTFVPRTEDALPAAVDVSFHDDCAARPPRDVLLGDLARFVTMVEAHTGKPILLRIARPVESTYALSGSLSRPIWALGNIVAPGYSARPWRLWRASDFRRIDGLKGPVNWDVVAP